MASDRDRVELALAGEVSYDELTGREQARVRAVWRRRVDARVAKLDFTPRLRASGQQWAEADADGKLIIHTPES